MTPKRERFVKEYMVDLNATQAAIRAGYSVKTAYSIGPELLTKPEIAVAISRERAEQSKRTGVNADRVINELAKLAFVNLNDVTDFESASVEGNPNRDDTAAIQSIKVKRIPTAEGDIVEREVKIHDKGKALEQLGRHLGIFNDKLRFEGGVSVVINDDLLDD